MAMMDAVPIISVILALVSSGICQYPHTPPKFIENKPDKFFPIQNEDNNVFRIDQHQDFGTPCKNPKGCSGDMWCSNDGRCTCKRGYHLNDKGNCVIGNAHIGSLCFGGLGCENVGNSTCSVEIGDGKCICPAGFHGVEGGAQCAMDSKMGDPCGSVKQCTGNSECKAKGGIGNCTCKEGFHANNTLVCVKGNAVIGSHCKNGLGCEYVRNAKCSVEIGDGKCICPAAFHGVEGGAQCGMGIRKECKYHDDCIVRAYCGGNQTCQCDKGFTSSADGLRCIAGIGKECKSDADCIENANCGGNQTCQCDEGFTSSDDGLRCLAGIGMECKSDADCIENANCGGNQTCQCDERFTSSDDGLRCIAVPGGECESDDDCIAKAICHFGFCHCDDGFTSSDDGRRCLARPGRYCVSDDDCTRNAKCDYFGFCHCDEGFTSSDEGLRCLAESVLGGGCAEDWQCSRPLGNSTCKNNLCICVDGAEFIKGKCYQQKKIGDRCSNLEECLKGNNTECAYSRCVCKSTMVAAGSNDKCLPKAMNPSDPCEEDIQCTEPFTYGAACVNGQCICQDSYHFKNHICMKNLRLQGEDLKAKAALNKNCTEFGQCINRLAECGNDSLCHCREGYVLDKDDWTCKAPVRRRCLQTDGCIDKLAECTLVEDLMICLCKLGTAYNEKLQSCSAGSRLIMVYLAVTLISSTMAVLLS